MSFLDSHNLRLHRDEHHALRLESPHMSTHVATVRRALPLSEPEKFLVLSDPLGDEIGVVRDLNELEQASREVLREALTRDYSITRITRILKVEREPLSGQIRWQVEIASDDETEEPAKQSQVLTALDQLEPHVVPLQNSATTKTVSSGTRSNAAGFNTHDGATGIGDKNGNASDGANESVDSTEASEGEAESDGKLLRRLRRRLRDRSEGDGSATQEREFSISGQEDVQTARYPHIYIVDTERNRYEIPDCEALDLESRRAAESYF